MPGILCLQFIIFLISDFVEIMHCCLEDGIGRFHTRSRTNRQDGQIVSDGQIA